MDEIISETEFWETYKPTPNPRDGSHVWEWEDTLEFPIERVWTLIDGDETDNQYAVTGYHIVNKFGYAVTEVPWTAEVFQGVWAEFETDR